MGDRAYMELVCRRIDASIFEDLGFHEEELNTDDLPEDVIFLIDPEANYGHDSDLNRLAKEGFVFCARHDQGGDYDASVIAADGSRYCSVSTIFSDGRPHVAIQREGTVDSEAIRSAVEYYLVEEAARRALGITGRLFSG